jgi:hypothetical protein
MFARVAGKLMWTRVGHPSLLLVPGTGTSSCKQQRHYKGVKLRLSQERQCVRIIMPRHHWSLTTVAVVSGQN